MQSRLASISKLNRILFSTPKSKNQTIQRHPPLFSSASTSGDGGNNMEDAMTQGVDTEGETGATKPEVNDHDRIIPTKEDRRYTHPKTTVPPNLSASKLETPAVNTPLDPHLQQKRSTTADLSCAGLDGWTGRTETSGRRKEEEDDKQYFDHHKASALSEIEIVDSRKPLTRVMANQGSGGGGYFGDEQVMTWTPEQLDTAEESLRRATEMFRESAARGIPELPHSRRLRELRGEDW